jgi:LAO/AO transport system kinase
VSTPEDDGLSVRPGAAGAPSVNPGLRVVAPDLPDAGDLFRGVREGDRVALARAITLVESVLERDRSRSLELLDLCQPHAGGAIRVGFSGAPGVGKSTLIDALGIDLVEAGRRVAVLAVDPSSERSGGSILGDKTRMGRLSALPGAYVRPTPSGGSLGGVARFTRPAITVVEAAGFDVVIVETVGVGQSETAVRHMVDTLVLLSMSRAGDELQGIKRGIVEAADVVAVTKADGDGREAALAARGVLRQAVHLLPADETEWRVPVLAVSALDRSSVTGLWEAVEAHHGHLVRTGTLEARRKVQGVRWLRDELTDRLLERFRAGVGLSDALTRAEAAVASGELHPYRAADDLVRRFLP